MKISRVRQISHRGNTDAVAWHPVGDCFAAAHSNGFIQFWDAHGVPGSQRIRLRRNAVTLSYSPCGKNLLLLDTLGFVYSFAWNGEKYIEQFVCDSSTTTVDNNNKIYVARQQTLGGTPGVDPRGEPRSASWDPSGRRVAICRDRYSFVYDPVNYYSLCSFFCSENPCACLAWSPKGENFAYYGERIHVSVSDGCRFQSAHKIGIENDDSEIVCVSQLAWSPDAAKLAGRGEWGWTRIWNTQSWELSSGYPTGGITAGAMSWSPDSRCVVSSGVPGARIWDSVSEKDVAVFPVDRARADIVSWSPKGKQIVVAGDDGIFLLDLDCEAPPVQPSPVQPSQTGGRPNARAITERATAAVLANDVLNGDATPGMLADCLEDFDLDQTGYQIQHLRCGNIYPAGFWAGQSDPQGASVMGEQVRGVR